MKLNARDAAAFFKKPDTALAAVLLFGPDAMRVALKRQDLVSKLVGAQAEEEMRFSRLQASDLRKDPAALSDALKAQGFFPGQRVVLVEGASEKQNKAFEGALADWQKGDAMLVVTAGQLNARAPLRKFFEGARNAATIAIYADPPSREEVEVELTRAGLSDVASDAMNDLLGLSRILDPGDFRQTLEKLALYKYGDATPLNSEDIAACAPLQTEAAVDDALHYIAEGNVSALGEHMQRISGQGLNPTTLCINATRHFQTLHTASACAEGVEAGIARARPPVFGPRRDRMLRQARHWGVAGTEAALSVLIDTDLALRSSRPLPALAMVERAFIRIAMMHTRR